MMYSNVLPGVTYADVQHLNLDVLTLERTLFVFGLGMLLVSAIHFWQSTSRWASLLDAYSVASFKAHWALEDIHSGVESDYQSLQNAFKAYFNVNPGKPGSLVRRLGILLAIEAVKGNLNISSSLLRQLKTLTQRVEEASGTNTDYVTNHAPHLPSPYTWSPALPEQMGSPVDAFNDVIHAESFRAVVSEEEIEAFKLSEKRVRDEKAIALVLAEILVFGHEGSSEIEEELLS